MLFCDHCEQDFGRLRNLANDYVEKVSSIAETGCRLEPCEVRNSVSLEIIFVINV